jgi:septum formation protein
VTTVPIILASTSTSRRMMLEAAGLVFTVVAPNVDEELMRDLLTGNGADTYTIAHALAEAKAVAVSEKHPGALTIGADQLLVCEERILSKAIDADDARRTLQALSGRRHELISAAVIAKDGQPIWQRTETALLQMCELSETVLDAYLTAEIPEVLGSVGCYRIEGRGVQLFREISGDHFCIRGLPLLAIIGALRDFGALPQ